MTKHFNISISGVVQGVFFRASTKEKADDLNISGFVRNERDGSVYIEAEGDEKDMMRFIEWCRHGPDRAEVERCDIREGAVKSFSGFAIKR